MNLLNSLRKRGKTLGKPRILSLTPTRLINSIKHEHSCKILYAEIVNELLAGKVKEIDAGIVKEIDAGIVKEIDVGMVKEILAGMVKELLEGIVK